MGSKPGTEQYCGADAHTNGGDRKRVEIPPSG